MKFRKFKKMDKEKMNGPEPEVENVENAQNEAGTAEQQAPETEEQQEEQKEAQTGEMSADVLKEALAASTDKYIRLAAEFDNYRRRTSKEKLDLIASAGENIIKGILPTLDDCERALDMLEKTDGDAAAKEGTSLIYNKLKDYLKGCGLAEIEAVGAEFDTDFHEAVAQFPVEDKEKKNKVIDVAQKGYTLNGKVIRYAKVVIGQ